MEHIRGRYSSHPLLRVARYNIYDRYRVSSQKKKKKIRTLISLPLFLSFICRKRSSLMYMITMEKSGRFFNPSRASPLDLVVRDSNRGRREAFIAKKPAVAISTGYCTDSNLVKGKTNKSISILFHGQEWERYCCFLTMIFDSKEMYAQVYKSALSFSTLPESVARPPVISNANVSPLSGRRAKINQTPVERSRGVLFFSDKGISFLSFPPPLFFFFFHTQTH